VFSQDIESKGVMLGHQGLLSGCEWTCSFDHTRTIPPRPGVIQPPPRGSFRRANSVPTS
jgi:hypothetical protein